jgi:hypothetical protein
MIHRTVPLSFIAGALTAGVIACDHRAPAPEPAAAPVDAQALVVPNDWPPLPKTPTEVANVVRDRGNRPWVAPSRPTIEAIKKQLGGEQVVAGDELVGAVLDGWVGAGDKPSFVLFGSLHDAGAQVDAFRRVATRMPHLWGVVMEQFKAQGAWPKAEVKASDVDDADLAEFFATGSDAALFRLRANQPEHDYAAWKFGYVDAVLDAVVAFRGANLPVYACDMPKSLLAPELEPTDEATTLREAHCAIAAREKLRLLGPAHVAKGEAYVDDVPPPMRAAFFVGDNHAGIGGLARFLHADGRIASVHLIGGRPEAEIPSDMAIVDPVLVPLAEPNATSWALLLPNASPGLVDRVVDRSGDARPRRARPAGDGTISAPTVWVESDGPARIKLAGGDVALLGGSGGEWLRVRPGRHACTITTGSRTITFALDVAVQGRTELHVDAPDAPAPVLHVAHVRD